MDNSRLVNIRLKKRCFYIALFLLVSCSKADNTHCWQCEYNRGKVNETIDYCNKTTEEIKAIEQSHTTGNAKMSCAMKY